MRVLLTTDTLGGVWTFTAELSRELLHRGNSVCLVSIGPPPSSAQAAWCVAAGNSFGKQFVSHTVTIPLEWMQDNAGAYADAAPELLRRADVFAPDLLHASQFCFGALPLPIPRLVTAHSDVLSWAQACRPHGLDASSWLTQYRSLVQEGLDGASGVVAPTRWMLKALADNFALPAQQEVVLNGRTLPLNSSSSERKLRAVSVGRLWDEGKNLALLTTLQSSMPIVVAGDHGHAATEPSSACIEMFGVLGESDLLALFRSSSIYLVPSIYEPFGLAPLEAALCGCAVLANDLPSLREVWGSAALYFSDATSLELLLHDLHDSPATLAQAQQRSHRRALQLTACRMADQYLALYQRALHGAPYGVEAIAAHA